MAYIIDNWTFWVAVTLALIGLSFMLYQCCKPSKRRIYVYSHHSTHSTMMPEQYNGETMS